MCARCPRRRVGKVIVATTCEEHTLTVKNRMTSSLVQYPEPTPTIETMAQEKIGRKLQDHYNHILSEPIPDKFLHLLNRLQTVNASARDGDEDGDDQ